jgi:hypothetical protein
MISKTIFKKSLLLPQNVSSKTILFFITQDHSWLKIQEFHQQIWNELKPKTLVGAVVDQINHQQGYSISMLDATTFTFNQGSQRLGKSVGRWHTGKTRTKLESKQITNSMFLITDNEPMDLIDMIKPNHVSGLLATPTPFLNGKPFTLFYNDKILDSGAVGFELDTSTLEYPQYHPLSAELEMTECNGNMITSISGLNPTQLLIDSSPSKKTDLFIQVNNSIKRVIGGDITRGVLAIDTSEPLVPGKIQFLSCQEKDMVLDIDGTTIKGNGLISNGIVNVPSRLCIR